MFGFTKWIFVGMISVVAIIVILGVSIFGLTGFSKDSILNAYDKVIEFFGNDSLTSDKELKGKREYGVDHYVGTYNADYDGYTGKEILFGGTSLKRKNSDHITIKIQLEKEDGNIKVINRLGEKDVTILEDSGEYDNAVYIEGMSYYLIVELDNFKGNLQVEVN